MAAMLIFMCMGYFIGIDHRRKTKKKTEKAFCFVAIAIGRNSSTISHINIMFEIGFCSIDTKCSEYQIKMHSSSTQTTSTTINRIFFARFLCLLKIFLLTYQVWSHVRSSIAFTAILFNFAILFFRSMLIIYVTCCWTTIIISICYSKKKGLHGYFTHIKDTNKKMKSNGRQWLWQWWWWWRWWCWWCDTLESI